MEIPSLPPSPFERVGVRSHFSVSITDDADIAIDSTNTILSSLLLSSELKGYIENPAWYLQDNVQSATSLDYLMMTHGWRRYNIPEVVRGNPEYPQIPFQASQQISGKVSGFLLRPVADSEVLIVSEEGGYGKTSTDEKGTFMFQDFEYPDSTSFMIQALNTRVKLDMDEESFPTAVHAPQNPLLTPALSEREGIVREETKSKPETNAFIMKAEQRAKYNEDMRVIYLSEIEVTTSRVKREPRLDIYLNQSATKTVRREQFERKHPTSVSNILSEIVGVRVSSIGDIRLSQGGRPLVFIDGVSVEWPSDDEFSFLAQSPVEAIEVSNVESIDVIMGVNASIKDYADSIIYCEKQASTRNITICSSIKLQIRIFGNIYLKMTTPI